MVDMDDNAGNGPDVWKAIAVLSDQMWFYSVVLALYAVLSTLYAVLSPLYAVLSPLYAVITSCSMTPSSYMLEQTTWYTKNQRKLQLTWKT